MLSQSALISDGSARTPLWSPPRRRQVQCKRRSMTPVCNGDISSAAPRVRGCGAIPFVPLSSTQPKPMAPLESNVRKLPTEAAQPYRTAPHNIEAEQALLGAILVNNEAFYRVSDFLEPRHFFEPVHQKIYEIGGSLIRAGKVAITGHAENISARRCRYRRRHDRQPISCAARRRSHNRHQRARLRAAPSTISRRAAR